LYQGYSLVGIHAFQWPGRSADNFDLLPLQPKKDPVQCIPSLRKIIAENPELDFFVHAYFLEAQKAVIVKCFVRSLPEGVDKKFDTVVSPRNAGTEMNFNATRYHLTHNDNLPRYADSSRVTRKCAKENWKFYCSLVWTKTRFLSLCVSFFGGFPSCYV